MMLRQSTHMLLLVFVVLITFAICESTSIIVNQNRLVSVLDGNHYLVSTRDSGIPLYLEVAKEWEAGYIWLIQRLLPSPQPEDIYIDVGANVGVWTLSLARHNPNGRVISIDAYPDSIHYLHANMMLNGIYNVDIVHAVLKENHGEVMELPYIGVVGNYGSYSLTMMKSYTADPANAEKIEEAGHFEVESWSLDHLAEQGLKTSSVRSVVERIRKKRAARTEQEKLQQGASSPAASESAEVNADGSAATRHQEDTGTATVGRIGGTYSGDKNSGATKDLALCPKFIKMDIELHELHALQGGIHMLRQCMPMLFIELDCASLSRSVLYLLDALGYSTAWVVSAQVTVQSPYIVDILKAVGYNPRLFLETVFAGVNILALPKAQMDAVLDNEDDGSGLKSMLYRIYPHMSPYIRDYSIKRCVGQNSPVFQAYLNHTGKALHPDDLCQKMTQVHADTHGLEEDKGFCGPGLQVAQEDVDYWKQWDTEAAL